MRVCDACGQRIKKAIAAIPQITLPPASPTLGSLGKEAERWRKKLEDSRRRLSEHAKA